MLTKPLNSYIKTLKHTNAIVFCRYFSSDKQNPNTHTSEGFSKDYLKKLKDNLSDFQNEFGFDQSLTGLRLDNIKREKKSIRNFNILAIAMITTSRPENLSSLVIF
jgi:hypothetical protein